MSLVTWESALATNIKFVDDDHKKLVSIVNELHAAMMSGKGKDILGNVLTALVNYTKTHFKNEELQMEKNKYPGYHAHLKAHQDLLKQVSEFYNKFKNGQAVITADILSFLKTWLVNHIQTMDKNMGEYLVAHGVK